MMRIKILKFATSIIGQLFMVAVATFLFIITGAIYGGNRTLETALLENIKSSVNQTSQLLNITVSTYASNNDVATIQTFLNEMLEENSKNGLTYVIVGDSHGKLLFSTKDFNKAIPTPDDNEHLEAAATRGEIHIRNAFLLPNREVGFLQYGTSTKNIIDATANEKINSILRTIFLLILSFSLILMLGRRISKRLNQLILATQEIVSGKYEMQLNISGRDELAVLARHFNFMGDAIQLKIKEVTELNLDLEARVQRRTNELLQSKKLLEENLVQLQQTQVQLINAEKLASLGSLVAGVAHELNTPIGNALTISTTVSFKVHEILELIHSGKIKKSELELFLTELVQAADLLSKSLDRASELIVSFKTVAVDQTSEHRRPFNLRQTIEELALTLSPQIKKTKFTLRLELPDDINLDSYPGPLIRVISNLFNNALIHAFEQRDAGTMTLSAQLDADDSDYVVIQFSDDGQGIENVNLDKIFDPFFTTKLGQGGSGLGLNICYNIVNGLLGGHISVASHLGKGSTFSIRLPLQAPHQVVANT